MTDYYSYKKIYMLSGDDVFKFNNKEFSGYAQLKGEVVTDYDSNVTLDPVNSYETDLFLSRYVKERTVDDLDIKLPNRKSVCTFGLNETINYDTLKHKLGLLRENNTFIYSRMFIATNRLPFTNKITYAYDNFANQAINIPAGNNTDILNTDKFSTNNNVSISKLGDVLDITSYTSRPSEFTMFCVTSSEVISLTGKHFLDQDNLEFGVLEDWSSYYQSLTSRNRLQFGELTSLATNSEDLFICDRGNNNILKYDIRNYTTLLSPLLSRRNLIGVLGGVGNTDRNTNFDEATTVVCDSNHIAVYDAGVNMCVKVYTTDFEYVTTLTVSQMRLNHPNIEKFGSMAFDPYLGELYMLTSTNEGSIFLYRMNIGTREREKVNMTETLDIESGEQINSITFSHSDSNYWFFGTTKNVYKKFKTRPENQAIGAFNRKRLYDDTNDLLIGLDVTSGVNGHDRVLMLSESRIYYFYEPTFRAYERVVSEANFSNYSSEIFTLHPDEYIQVPVINYEIHKLAYDTTLLKNNLIGRFAGKYIDDNIILQTYNYNFNKTDISTGDECSGSKEELFVHHNEENIIGALNRGLDRIYDLQAGLLDISQVDISDCTQTVPVVGDQPGDIATLEITKTVDTAAFPPPYAVGNTVRYNIAVNNPSTSCFNSSGPSVSGIHLYDDTIPIADRFNVIDISGLLDGSVILAPGQSASVVYDYTIKDGDFDFSTSQGFTNTVYISSSNSVPLTANASAVIGDFYSPITVNKSVISSGTDSFNNPGEQYYTLGDTITYTILITNPLGNDTITDVIAQDSLQGISNISNQALFGAGVSIEEGKTVSSTYTYTVTQQDIDSGSITNSVTVTSSLVVDVNSNSVVVQTYEPYEKSLSVVKSIQTSVTPGPYYVGSEIAYEVVIENTGDIPVSNIQLVDSLSNITITTPPAATLQPGAQTVAQYTYTATLLDVGTLLNTAIIQSDVGNFSSNTTSSTIITCRNGMDIIFAIDATGSMGSIINAVKAGLTSLADLIDGLVDNSNYRLGLISVTQASGTTTSAGNIVVVEEELTTGVTGTASRDNFDAALDFTVGLGNATIPAHDVLYDIMFNDLGSDTNGLRDDVATYVIFLTDTAVGPGGTANTANTATLAKLAEARDKAIERGIKVFMMGPGLANPAIGTTAVFNAVSVAAYKNIADQTDGAWSTSADPSTIGFLLQQSCQAV